MIQEVYPKIIHCIAENCGRDLTPEEKEQNMIFCQRHTNKLLHEAGDKIFADSGLMNINCFQQEKSRTAFKRNTTYEKYFAKRKK